MRSDRLDLDWLSERSDPLEDEGRGWENASAVNKICTFILAGQDFMVLISLDRTPYPTEGLLFLYSSYKNISTQ